MADQPSPRHPADHGHMMFHTGRPYTEPAGQTPTQYQSAPEVDPGFDINNDHSGSVVSGPPITRFK